MKVKTIIEEDFTNYKLPVMFIGTIKCSGKCYKELSISETICHNHEWNSMPIIEIADSSLIERYLSNPITKGICFGGLEPFEQFDEIISFIETLHGNAIPAPDFNISLSTNSTSSRIGRPF